MEERFDLIQKISLRRAFVLSKNQATHRGEDWDITFEQFSEMWRINDNWLYRGRGKEAMIFCRIDPTLGWTLDNVTVMPRKEWYKHYWSNVKGEKQ